MEENNSLRIASVLATIGTDHHLNTSLAQCFYANLLSHKIVMLHVSQHSAPTEYNISFQNLNYNHD